MTSRLWIKICGIRDVETALLASRSGADAIGLNFYAPSPRSLSVKTAAEIVKNLPASTTAVGLFVNHTVDEIETILNATRIGIVQLHGDETPEFLAQLTRLDPRPELIWARRVAVEDIPSLGSPFDRCRELGVTLKACLLDARVEGAFGGTGRVLPWDEIAGVYDRAHWPPLILAGGLTPENVRQAIESVQPWGIDTASGVESAPGVKDPPLLERFLKAARQAGHHNPSSGPSP
ncbi:MAG TPA: phosphoribosylanthranilate isomerase [Planctomycetaceae bacterium]|nr:phosphoribosylanthranilate isomerase [Planctomycetaceae bacterium]